MSDGGKLDDNKSPSEAGDDSDEDEKKKAPSRLKQITVNSLIERFTNIDLLN